MKQANQPADDQPAVNRRKLLGAAGTTGALAAAATVLATRRSEPDAAPDAPDAAPNKGGGYRLTEHVMRYYQTTRI
ncbi:MAG: formate dehydrogenase [Burkholderiaceae bacterium]|nr:formate dehydrogenase [Burkholderiaceae bacterium]